MPNETANARGTARGLGARPGRVGIMGGTFDPIHHGHLVAASEVAHLFHLDEVVFVPTGQPYQKDLSKVASAEDRYLMTVIATAENPQFRVSRIEIDREGPTYTLDTLREMRAMYGPDVELFFITGADALGAILSWHNVDELFDLAHFVGCNRPDTGSPTPDFPTARSAWWRFRHWRSPRRSAGSASARANRSGTWCPTVSSAISTRPGSISTTTCRDSGPGEAAATS